MIIKQFAALCLEFHDFRTLVDSYAKPLTAQVSVDYNRKHFDDNYSE